MKTIKLLLVMLFSVVVAACGGGNNSNGSSGNTTNIVTAGNFTTARISATATRLPTGKVLVAGGWGGAINASDAVNLASAELYDPAANTWSTASSMLTARESHTATVLPNGKVLVAGGSGSGNNNFLASAELYDSTTNTWSPAGNMLTAYVTHTATLLPGGKVLLVGDTTAQLYDPNTNAWTWASSPLASDTHTATLLSNGKVLVTGGWGNGVALSSAELYNPATNSWTAAGSLSTARSNNTATLLSNGKVLVAGGIGNSGSLASVEIYDPATSTWAAAANLGTARDSHSATLLSNGKVLVAEGNSSTLSGGGLSVNANFSSIELYDPISNAWTPSGSLKAGSNTHTATLLLNGNVLFAGESGELYLAGGAGSTGGGSAGGSPSKLFAGNWSGVWSHDAVSNGATCKWSGTWSGTVDYGTFPNGLFTVRSTPDFYTGNPSSCGSMSFGFQAPLDSSGAFSFLMGCNGGIGGSGSSGSGFPYSGVFNASPRSVQGSVKCSGVISGVPYQITETFSGG